MNDIQFVEIIEPLYEAMENGNEEACIGYLKKYPALLTKSLNSMDEKMIHLACYYHLPRVLDYVIKQKVDVHEKSRQEKNAVFYADTELIMENLHKAGISFNELNNLGHTPLIMSFFVNEYSKIKWLIKYGADVNIQDKYKHTILDYIEDGHEDFDIHFLMTYYEQFSPENQKKLKKIRLKQLVERGNFHVSL